MKDIIIREAQRQDLNDILRLNLALFKKEFKEYDKTLNIKWTYSQKGKDYFKKRIINKDGFAAVAVNDGEIVGYICCGLHKNSTRKTTKAELENIMVIGQYRNQKIGSRLVRIFFTWCKTKKIKDILVTASTKNLSGIRFYKKLGFNDYSLILEKKLT